MYSDKDLTQLPDSRAIPFVAITTLVMAFSMLAGPLSIILMYALWLPLIYYKGQFTIRPSVGIIFPILFALYCLLSSIWSDYPAHSLYSATQYASMIMCAIIIAQRVNLNTFLKGIALGTTLVLMVPLLIDTTTAMRIFGSKNQIGFFAEISVFTSTLLFFHIKKSPQQLFAFCIMPFLISSICLITSHSASSVLSTAAVLTITALAYGVGTFSKTARLPILLLILFGAFTIAFSLYAFQIDLQGEVLEFFGKDRTLTGRTDLWADGLSFAKQRLVLGDGYSAFWMQGRPEAERLWAEFYIDAKTGFHFHNLFVQTLVDLGITGLILLITMLGVLVIRSMKNLLRHGALLGTLFPLGLSFLFLTRSLVEVDILNAYGIGPLLFFSALPRQMIGNNTSC